MKRSVTQVLDYSIPPQLANWFKNNSKAKCEAIGNETARIGSLVDSLIQQDIREGGYVPPEQDEFALNCLKQWEILKSEHPEFVPSIKEMQIEVVDGDLIGHFDYYCEEKSGGWGITDLKCTSGIRFKNYVQEARYAKSMMKEKGLPFPAFVRTVRLPREADKKYEWSEIRDPEMIQYCMDLFEHYDGIFLSEYKFKEYFRTQIENQLLGDF
jgi:hypothetical protein